MQGPFAYLVCTRSGIKQSKLLVFVFFRLELFSTISSLFSKMSALYLILLIFCILLHPAQAAPRPSTLDSAPQQPSPDNIPHRDYEIPEEAIIELPFGRFPEPQCDYSVHSEGPSGPAVSRARIGDPLYHKWRCDTPNANSHMFCILVNNCTVSTVSSARPIKHPIIDGDGCTLEPQILPDVSYESDLEGGILCNAFSLGFDQPTISFNCGIKLLLKDDAGVCHRPQCPRRSTTS